MPVTYIKIYKGGEWQKVESGRLQQFLDLGWSQDDPKSEKKSQPKGKKEKISASAEVTSQPNVEDEKVEDIEPTEEELDAVPCIECGSEEHSYKDCGEDNWTYSEDDFTPKEEN